MERIDDVYRELDDTENSPDLIGQTEVNINTQEEQMLAVVQEDPETSQTSEHEQVENNSTTGAANQPEDDNSVTSITATNIPVQRIETLKVSYNNNIFNLLLYMHRARHAKGGFLVVVMSDVFLSSFEQKGYYVGSLSS